MVETSSSTTKERLISWRICMKNFLHGWNSAGQMVSPSWRKCLCSKQYDFHHLNLTFHRSHLEQELKQFHNGWPRTGWWFLLVRTKHKKILKWQRPSTSKLQSKDCSATVAVTITFTAAGNQLQSLIIFKGKEYTNRGKILKQELKSYPVEAIYATQEKVWMSKCMMFLWVEMIFKPFVATGSPRIAPLPFLGSYKVHMMALVNNAITGLGVVVIIIPPSNSTSYSRIVCMTNTRVGWWLQVVKQPPH